MKGLTFQKIISLFVIVIFLGLGFFLYNHFYSSPSSTLSPQDLSSSFNSPCRGLVKQSKRKVSFEAPAARLKILNNLMETPIDWILKDIHGEVLDLYCYRDRKKVFINLWATWCAPCIEELPSLSLLAEKYPQDILILAITTESLERVHSFIKEAFSDLSPKLKIVKVSLKEQNSYFPQDSLPITYIFDKKGRLDNKIVGSRDWMKVDSYIIK